MRRQRSTANGKEYPAVSEHEGSATAWGELTLLSQLWKHWGTKLGLEAGCGSVHL